MEKIKFTKMNGLGNDFVILDYEEYEKTGMAPDALALKLCNRSFGIGADGLIIVNRETKDANISWIFYNSDGSVAEMCGNGIRCFARYVYDKKIIDKNIYNNVNNINARKYNSKNNSKNKILLAERQKINPFLFTNTNLSVNQIKNALINFCKKNNYQYSECKENKYIIFVNKSDSFILEINNESKGRIIRFFHYKGSDEITKKNINKLWYEMSSNIYS